MKRLFLSLLLVIVTATSCTKENKAEEATGTVRDYTGLDGCGIMIDLDGGGSLEIISLPANTSLITGRRVKITFKSEPRMSNCMAGTTAHIKSLQYI